MSAKRYCYWTVATGPRAAWMQECVHSARRCGVFTDIHVLTDRPLEDCECYDACQMEMESGLFRFIYLKVGMTKLNYDYFVWLDADTLFRRKPLDLLACLGASPIHAPLGPVLPMENPSMEGRSLPVRLGPSPNSSPSMEGRAPASLTSFPSPQGQYLPVRLGPTPTSSPSMEGRAPASPTPFPSPQGQSLPVRLGPSPNSTPTSLDLADSDAPAPRAAATWKGMSLAAARQALAREGVLNDPRLCHSAFWIVHRDAIDAVHDLAVGFHHKTRASGVTLHAAAALGYAVQILCGNPERHVQPAQPELWAETTEEFTSAQSAIIHLGRSSSKSVLADSELHKD